MWRHCCTLSQAPLAAACPRHNGTVAACRSGQRGTVVQLSNISQVSFPTIPSHTHYFRSLSRRDKDACPDRRRKPSTPCRVHLPKRWVLSGRNRHFRYVYREYESHRQLRVHANPRPNRIVSPHCCSTITQGPSHETRPRSPRSILRYHIRAIPHRTAWCRMVLLVHPLIRPALATLDSGCCQSDNTAQTPPATQGYIRLHRFVLMPFANAQNASICTARGALTLPSSHRHRTGKGEITEQTTAPAHALGPAA